MAQEARLRKDARTIFRAALEAADPEGAVLRFVRREGETLWVGKRRYALKNYRRIVLLGAGKASAAMARAVERLLGARVTAGLVVTKYGHELRLKRVAMHEAGHPVPDEKGVVGARRLAGMADGAGADELVIVLISGGASALTPYPAEPITLAEKQATTRLLLECGATIHEINAVRKHISAFKGGWLARRAQPATVVTLMLSDVIGDPMDVIGSGPTVPDESTYGDAQAIFLRYGLWERVPAAVRERIEAGLRGEVEETPKAGDAAFARTQNLIVGSNKLAVDAAAQRARELGYRALVLTTALEGEAREVARVLAAVAKEVRGAGRPVRAPACVIAGGETTVTIRGNGKGGRNQEMALVGAMELAGLSDVVMLSGGTDGTDGPTDAAGGIADGRTVERAGKLGLKPREYLERNDSYHFLEALGDLIKTGPTGTNVMDVQAVLVG